MSRRKRPVNHHYVVLFGRACMWIYKVQQVCRCVSSCTPNIHHTSNLGNSRFTKRTSTNLVRSHCHRHAQKWCMANFGGIVWRKVFMIYLTAESKVCFLFAQTTTHNQCLWWHNLYMNSTTPNLPIVTFLTPLHPYWDSDSPRIESESCGDNAQSSRNHWKYYYFNFSIWYTLQRDIPISRWLMHWKNKFCRFILPSIPLASAIAQLQLLSVLNSNMSKEVGFFATQRVHKLCANPGFTTHYIISCHVKKNGPKNATRFKRPPPDQLPCLDIIVHLYQCLAQQLQIFLRASR